jgi:hypothetical protein
MREDVDVMVVKRGQTVFMQTDLSLAGAMLKIDIIW